MYGKMQESGLTEIIPLICTSAIWGQYPDTSWVSSGLTQGVAAVWCLLDGRHSFQPWVSSADGSRWRAAIVDDCDILCLLIWQEIFHFSYVTTALGEIQAWVSGCAASYWKAPRCGKKQPLVEGFFDTQGPRSSSSGIPVANAQTTNSS